MRVESLAIVRVASKVAEKVDLMATLTAAQMGKMKVELRVDWSAAW